MPQTERVLVLMPTAEDARRTVALLAESGVKGIICAELAELCRELRVGAGAVLLTDDAIFSDATGQLAEAVRAQPAWSTMPVIVLARENSTRHVTRAASDALSGLMVVERPLHMRTLLSVVLSALRTRRHQYQIRDAMAAREEQAEALRAQEEMLRVQAEQLRQADRRKDEFLATLAHELRNPLAPLRTGMDLLGTAPTKELAERTRGVMQRQLDHMVRLIDDLLDVARITRGKLELKCGPTTLGAVVRAAVEASAPLVERGRHRLSVLMTDEHLLLNADLTRLAQVVSNLLNNSSKYTPPGGQIELRARAEATEAVIEVVDNGVGIPPEHLEQVFELFSQVNRELDRTQGGLGIGLALVHRLVEMHGGRVTAESAGLGHGTTFRVRLPALHEESVAVTPKDSTLGPAPAMPKRVLVVDDNEDAVSLLALLLEHAGYATRVAEDGPSALQAALSFRPEVVILDIGLPGLDGYEVARELRARGGPISLIALTGWGTQDDMQKAFDAGFDLHLTKPVSAQELCGALLALDQRGAVS